MIESRASSPDLRAFLFAMLGGVCALGLFFFLSILLFGLIVPAAGDALEGRFVSEPQRPDDEVVLLVDLRASLPDRAQSSPIPFLSPLGFVDILTRLDGARYDDNVKGVILRVGWNGVGHARSEEIRRAVLALREAGKFVYGYTQDLGLGLSGYRAIAAADRVVMQPGSEFSVSGVGTETLFFKSALERIGITGEFEAAGEYKNAPDVFTRDDYSDAHREQLESIIESLLDLALTDIAADRGLDRGSLRDLLARTPTTAADAMAAGLIDELAWPEDFMDEAGDEAGLMPIVAYAPPEAKGPVVALVSAEGPIVTGGTELGGGEEIVSDEFSARILGVARQEEVEAMVLRVDSPGGSPAASEQIRHTIARVREGVGDTPGKPVVISMGSVAASGGYWMALGADLLVASGATLTGSIGVYGGKLAFADGLRKIGVEVREISRGGPMTTALSSEVLTDTQRDRLRAALERIYDQFVDLVADARDMPIDRARSLAEGRVWTGDQASVLGLVDETGGLTQAARRAAELAGIETERVNLRAYNRQPDFVDAVRDFVGVAVQLRRLARAAGDADLAARIDALLASGEPQARMVPPATR